MYNGKNQRKTFPAVQLKTRGAAPPVYRPNPVPRVCQLRAATPQPKVVAGTRVAQAPPVYRPQPLPKVLQRKVVNQPPSNLRKPAPAPLAPRTRVIQRNIDSTHFEKSAAADPLYLINPLARETLYSQRHAPPPRPQGLYSKKVETDDADGSQVFAWKPNVRFFSNEERTFDDQMMYGPEGGRRHLDLPGLRHRVENPAADPSALEQPTFGMLGKNDCTSFAMSLYNRIARETYWGEEDDEEQIYQVKTADYPAISVGDMMVHKFETGQCRWHGATVVAEDRDRQVTLEADVSRDSAVPHFHIRRGVASFVAYNNQDSDEPSTKVEITKYLRGKPPDGDVRRYEAALGFPNLLKGSVTTTRALPMSIADQNLWLPLGHLVLSARWNTQGEGFFPWQKKTPDGVVKMRTAYNQRKYWDVFRIAEEKDRTHDSNRSSLVRDLYSYLSEVWRQLKAAAKGQLPALLRQVMGDIGRWDRELSRS